MMKLDTKYTVNEALAILAPAKVKRTALYKLINTGEIKPFRIMSKVYIPASEVRKILAQRLPPPGWLTTDQTCAVLKIAKTTFWNLVAQKKLRVRKVVHITYVDPASVKAVDPTFQN